MNRRSFLWHVEQIPDLIGFLRASLVGIGSTQYDAVRVDGTRERTIPFKKSSDETYAHEEADQLWALLVWYSREVAYEVGGAAPQALREAWTSPEGDILLRASVTPQKAAEGAREITGWLGRNVDRIEGLDENLRHMEDVLFSRARHLMARLNFSPRQLRTSLSVCLICGCEAVWTEWIANRAGDVEVAAQCTVCGVRLDPSRAERLEVRAEQARGWGSADVQASSEAGQAVYSDREAVAT